MKYFQHGLGIRNLLAAVSLSQLTGTRQNQRVQTNIYKQLITYIIQLILPSTCLTRETETNSASTNHKNRRAFRILIQILLIPWYYFVVAIPCCKAVRMLTDNGTCTIEPMDGISNVISYFYKIEKERFSKHMHLCHSLYNINQT